MLLARVVIPVKPARVAVNRVIHVKEAARAAVKPVMSVRLVMGPVTSVMAVRPAMLAVRPALAVKQAVKFVNSVTRHVIPAIPVCFATLDVNYVTTARRCEGTWNVGTVINVIPARKRQYQIRATVGFVLPVK